MSPYRTGGFLPSFSRVRNNLDCGIEVVVRKKLVGFFYVSFKSCEYDDNFFFIRNNCNIKIIMNTKLILICSICKKALTHRFFFTSSKDNKFSQSIVE